MLLPLAGLCMDAAVNRFIIRERLGTKEIREQAFRELEKAEEEQVSDKAGTDLIHRIRLLYIRHVLENTDDRGMDPQAVRRIREYVELNYGKSYLSESEQARVNRKFCTGIHKNCNLYLTDGILQSPVIKNNQYRFSQLQFEKNKAYYGNNHWIIKRNISVLAESLKRAFIIRKDDFVSRSDAGQLVPERLWKIGRTDDDKLFNRKKRSDDSEFVIDVLIDSSGSQADRQAQVAAQGYIISEALSQAGIPHRVTGYCAFWGYTVLQRFRDYEDPRETNERIFQFRAYANNRDGLALKTVGSSLMERPEKNKILKESWICGTS